MNIYLDIIKFNFLRFLTYPHEIVAVLATKITELGLLLLFWYVISKSSNGSINYLSLTSYFLISTSINNIVMGEKLIFGQFLNKLIKKGEINSYIIKPIQLIPYLYFSNLGLSGLVIILAVFSFMAGIIIHPPANLLMILVFLILLALSIIISLSFNLFIGILSFNITEASSIRHTLGHIIKVFSGAWIPLTFFPHPWKEIAFLTPFSSMIYLPTISLQKQFIDNEIIIGFFISVFWAVTLTILALYFWNKSIRKYDAVGI